MAILKRNKTDTKKMIGIWPLVGAIYGPITFWFLVLNLPQVTQFELKNFFESKKFRYFFNFIFSS